MVVVIFEVWPAAGRAPEYLDIAARLKPELEAIDGFISVERFEIAMPTLDEIFIRVVQAEDARQAASGMGMQS